MSIYYPYIDSRILTHTGSWNDSQSGGAYSKSSHTRAIPLHTGNFADCDLEDASVGIKQQAPLNTKETTRQIPGTTDHKKSVSLAIRGVGLENVVRSTNGTTFSRRYADLHGPLPTSHANIHGQQSPQAMSSPEQSLDFRTDDNKNAMAERTHHQARSLPQPDLITDGTAANLPAVYSAYEAPEFSKGDPVIHNLDDNFGKFLVEPTSHDSRYYRGLLDLGMYVETH
jgi:hypothetical protein